MRWKIPTKDSLLDHLFVPALGEGGNRSRGFVLECGAQYEAKLLPTPIAVRRYGVPDCRVEYLSLGPGGAKCATAVRIKLAAIKVLVDPECGGHGFTS